jgi:Ras-related protein Rab-18
MKDFNLVFVGESGVGKTSIVRKYNNNSFELESDVTSTIGIDMTRVELTLNNEEITLLFWNTAGQERFRSITPTFY